LLSERALRRFRLERGYGAEHCVVYRVVDAGRESLVDTFLRERGVPELFRRLNREGIVPDKDYAVMLAYFEVDVRREVEEQTEKTLDNILRTEIERAMGMIHASCFYCIETIPAQSACTLYHGDEPCTATSHVSWRGRRVYYRSFDAASKACPRDCAVRAIGVKEALGSLPAGWDVDFSE
jgi:hypothetical protein